MGQETADQVSPVAIDWIRRNGRRDDWFLHIHFWDPHTPYRTPLDFGDPFSGSDAPDWITEDVRGAHWLLPGPHSAQEVTGFTPGYPRHEHYPRQPEQIDCVEQVRRMFDGYDTGVRYADEHVGRVCNEMADLGILEEAAVMVSTDHGENLGELGIYCDHQTADYQTQRLPLIIRWPGTGCGRVDRDLHYHIDAAATVLELLGLDVPPNWDATSFADSLQRSQPSGRKELILSHAAWTVQRAVRFDDWICIRTYHDALHGFAKFMLYDVANDPHEQQNLASSRPDVVEHASALLSEWLADAMVLSDSGVDPMWTVMAEGGGWHARTDFTQYLDRLRQTGRAEWADRLATNHREESESRNMG